MDGTTCVPTQPSPRSPHLDAGKGSCMTSQVTDNRYPSSGDIKNLVIRYGYR